MRTVLVVDDEAIYREPIAGALTNHGLRAVSACSAEEALAYCREQAPDLILLDVVMPGMDGLQALRTIRRDALLRDIPVILLTNATDRNCIFAARKTGIQGYLLKSCFSLHDLLDRIAALLDPAAKGLVGAAPSGSSAKKHGHPPGRVAAAHPKQAKVAAETHAAQDRITFLRAAVKTAHAQSNYDAMQPPLPIVHSNNTSQLNREMVIRRLEDLGTLRTLPGSVAEVIAIASSPRASRTELTAALERDPVCATRILRLSNSNAYAGNHPRIHSVDDAISVVGFEGVRNLATTIGIVDALPMADAAGMGAIRCWQHSLAVATLMDRLAVKNDPDQGHGLPHLVGLCHDLGEIALRQYFTDQYNRIVELADQTGRPQHQLRKEIFGFSNKELSILLLTRLGLPNSIIDGIRRCPLEPGEEMTGAAGGRLPTTLQIADWYAHGLQLASSVDSLISPILCSELERIGFREVPALDTWQFRSEILASTNMLVRETAGDEVKLSRPLIPQRSSRICYVRPAIFAEFDPLYSALELLAVVEMRNTVPNAPEAAPHYDGWIVVDASKAKSPGPLAPKWCEVLAARPVLHLVPHLVASADALVQNMSTMQYPISLDALGKFVAALDAGA
jgi:twitching motility two-component system response regulator PilH